MGHGTENYECVVDEYVCRRGAGRACDRCGNKSIRAALGGEVQGMRVRVQPRGEGAGRSGGKNPEHSQSMVVQKQGRAVEGDVRKSGGPSVQRNLLRK